MTVYPVLISVKPNNDYQLELLFGEGEKRLYDFKPNLEHKYYNSLIDLTLFKKVSVNNGEIEWVTGQDFCPYTLYERSIPIT